MAYWWVSQNKTFDRESEGGYLWAPLSDSRGNTPYHWKNMELIEPGDLIFSYVGRAISAISISIGKAVPSDRPEGFEDEGGWGAHGVKVSARYLVLPVPIPVKSLPEEVLSLLKGEYKPLDVNGDGKQAYLFEVPPEAGRCLIDTAQTKFGWDFDFFEAQKPGATQLPGRDRDTETESLRKSRIGQGEFRKELMRIWGAKCPLTGISTECLLRASHSKPWKDSNNVERLDPNNGLLLAVGADAAFDGGLITFEDDGRIRMSPKADANDLVRAGISIGMRITGITAAQAKYLEYHRLHVFLT